jgi:hypothetical protein
MLVLIRSKTTTALLVSFSKMQNLALRPDFYFVLIQTTSEKPTIPTKYITPKIEKISIMKTRKSITKLKRLLDM